MCAASGLARPARSWSGAGARADHRQGHPHLEPAGQRAGGQVWRPPAAVPLEEIYAREGVPLPRSTLAQWVGQCGVQLSRWSMRSRPRCWPYAVLHADETPVEMLKPGHGQDAQGLPVGLQPRRVRAMKAVVYDFAESRSGEHARAFLGDWRGSLICDDYGGYKASFAQGITEVGCMAHARRKFFDLHANGTSQIAGQALQTSACCTTSSEKPRTQRRRSPGHPPGQVTAHCRRAARLDAGAAQPGGPGAGHGQSAGLQPQALAGAHALHRRRQAAHRQQLDREPDAAHCHWAQELAVCGLAAGRPACGRHHEPDPVGQAQWAAYLKDVLARLPTQKNNRIDELLPHNWTPLIT
jgi:transposase